MTDPSRRASARGINRIVLALLVLLGLSSGLASEAFGQCSAVTGPTKLTCPDCKATMNPPQVFNPGAGWVGVYKNSAGSDRLLVPMTWGTITYSLASPAFPNELAVWDLRDPGQNGPGAPTRDGQSYGTSYGISSDGQRQLFSLHIPMAQTLVSVPNGEKFSVQGNTGFTDASVVVQISGSRYISYGLGTNGSFFAVDSTTLPGYTGAMPFEAPSLFSSHAQSLGLAEGGSPLKQYLYSYDTSVGVIVVDVSNPGPVGGITSGFVARSIPTATFGLPGKSLVGVSAAVDPATGNLYVLGSFWDNSTRPAIPSFSLVLFEGGTSSLIGTYTAPFEPVANPSFNSAAGQNVGTLAVNPGTGVVMTFMLVDSVSLNTVKLYAMSATNFGSPITQSADIVGTAGSLAGTKILFKSGSDTYAYFWDGSYPWAMRLSCRPVRSRRRDASPSSNASTGGALASGATVFVGDTLTVTPSVSPSNSIQPVTGWNLDLDYHSATETEAIGLMQLANPDACLSGCPNSFAASPDPPPSASPSWDRATTKERVQPPARLLGLRAARARDGNGDFRVHVPRGRDDDDAPDRLRSRERPQHDARSPRDVQRRLEGPGRQGPGTSRRCSTAAPRRSGGRCSVMGHPPGTSGTSARTTRRRFPSRLRRTPPVRARPARTSSRGTGRTTRG